MAASVAEQGHELAKQGHELAKQGQQLARQSKQSDVVSEFNRRFGRVWEMRSQPEYEANPSRYYERFWNLQFDQFRSWYEDGFVPERLFEYWMKCRREDWVADKELGTVKYRDGFRKAIDSFPYSDFNEFFAILHRSDEKEAIKWAKERR